MGTMTELERFPEPKRPEYFVRRDERDYDPTDRRSYYDPDHPAPQLPDHYDEEW